MRRSILASMTFIFTFSLLIGIMGCGEVAEEPAIILETDPGDGSRMFAVEDLTITFDRAVAEVKVNGTPADVDDTQAFWNGLGLEAGKQNLTIEWTDESGGTNSEDITLTIQELDLAVCSGGPDCTGPDCDLP